MTTKATHTPTPWDANGTLEIVAGKWGADVPTVAVCCCDLPHGWDGYANAAHIVKCVNAHAALVAEVSRLRRVLQGIAASRPDAHMDIEKTPELTAWICDACHTASVGAYPADSNADKPDPA